MVKHSIVCICLFALLVVVNAKKTIDETKAEIQELDKKLIEKINKLDELERQKVTELDDTVEEDFKKESEEFQHLLDSIESHAEHRIKRQAGGYAYQAPAATQAAPSYQSAPTSAPAPAAQAPSYAQPAPVAQAPSYAQPAPVAQAPSYAQPAPVAQAPASYSQPAPVAAAPAAYSAPAPSSSYGGAAAAPDMSGAAAGGQAGFDMSSMMMMQQPQQPIAARSPLGMPGSPFLNPTGNPLSFPNPLLSGTPVLAPAAVPAFGARSPVFSGLAPFEKLRLAPFSAIRKLSFNGADPALGQANNANGNPLPNTCARGVSEPIYEGFQITESYCRCPDGSYGFTCQEGFGNPCAGNDQQFYQADSRIPNNYFIHCSNYAPYLKKCPAGLVWDQVDVTCNWPPAPSAGGSAYGGAAAAPIPQYQPPSYSQPAATPSYQQPAATPAATPSYQQPAATPAATPSYQQPAATPAATPSYQAPQAQQAAPSYQAPQAQAAPGYSQQGGLGGAFGQFSG